MDNLVYFAVTPQDSYIVGKRGRRSVIRVLGTHHPGD